MAGNQAGDVWTIGGEDRAKHDAQFFQLKPINGFITGNQARDFFMQSGLATQILGQIWGLADMNGDGKMDKKEFSVAMHLIKKKLQGYALPKALPPSLKADPSPVIGSLGQPTMGTSMGMNLHGAVPNSMLGGGMGMMQGGPMPMMPPQAPQAALGTNTMTTGSLGGGPRMANGGSMPLSSGAGGVPPPVAGANIWAMTHSNKLKHTQTFNVNDRNKRGYLLGVEGRSLLMQSGLPQQVLAQIWTLSDVDQDGKLTCDEFCIAMHLAELARMGHAMPPKLPAELIPTKTRSGSITSPPPATPKKDAFGDLLGGMDSPIPAMPVAQPVSQTVEEEEQVTFEDKRKENFDKGQAELERRRALLREQQQQETNARMEKERQEVQKRERQRLEAETKRQAELQRQLEKQREKEREIEEQRRKMIEQRETARRELERKRQMEWEAQRKEQLLQEKQREYEQLSVLKTQMASLKAELESLDGKKTEVSMKISQVQAGVADFTSNIDSMRVSRDRALADIDLYDRQSKEFERKMSGLGSEKDALNVQVQTAQATPLSDTHRTVMSSVEMKRTGIERLKTEVKQLESDTEARLGEIDCNNAELKNLKDQLAKLNVDLPKMQKQQQEKLVQQKKAAEEAQQKQRLEKERQDKLKREMELEQQKKAQTAQASIPSSEPNWFDFNSSDAGKSATTTSTAGSESSTNWDSAFSGSNDLYGNVSSAWGTNGTTTAGGSQQKTKCKALYDFAGTREDELSFSAGQEIMVLNEEPIAGMEDWYKGEVNGASGWFPKAYVEKVDTSQPVSFGSAFEPVAQSSSQSQSEDLFSSNSTMPDTSAIASSTAVVSQGSSEGLLAKATYPWKARQESDLTFDKDDVILVQKQEEMRWFGVLNGKSGWFPKAYVKLIGVAPKTDSDQVNEDSNHLSSSGKDTLTSSQTESQEGGGGEYYVAMYTYTSEEPSDLNFNEGDMILLTGKNGDWWTGVIPDKERSGIFPANYVKKLDIQPEQKSLKKPEIARVIAPYLATGTGQLSLETGNLINVRQKSPRGWWEGELQVRGQKKKIGWFPANYVKLLGSGSARSTPEPSSMTSLAVGGPSSRSTTPQSIASQEGVPGINQPETVVALYAYQAQNDDELTFQKDAIITVLSRDNPDWWNGQLDGVSGVFPSNYVTPNPQSQSWMNDTVQEEMSKSERKRQHVIQELISTEESYNSDMLVALEVFKKPMIESGVLDVEHTNLIFVNWEELIVCNKKLLQALRVRKKMSGTNGVIHIIGDLLCESIPHMNPYMRFCSCQLNAAAALQKASENHPSFQEFHKLAMQNPKVKGVHLSGFLLRPMQRITRYPLLIEKILAHTPPEHADRTNVEEALSLAQELCAQVNQCVKEKQNTDHLEWIQAHVNCDGLAQNIVFNSLTNCLGPRRLLFTGILYKVKSNKELVGFLFNDIFLLAQTSRPLGTNFSSLHLFDTNFQFKMYRLPIFLNEVAVKKCPEDTDPSQFQVTSDRILNLKAVSSIERETWVRQLETASKNYKDKAKRKLERAHSAMRGNPVGRALVVVEEGVGLCCPAGKSDPYCEVSMGSQEHRTKVIPSTLNPRWNASMQFFIRDVDRDTLCFTVYDRDLFSPNDFLGRTEVRIKDVLDESGGERRGPITKRLILHEVETGEVIVKLDLLLFES